MWQSIFRIEECQNLAIRCSINDELFWKFLRSSYKVWWQMGTKGACAHVCVLLHRSHPQVSGATSPSSRQIPISSFCSLANETRWPQITLQMRRTFLPSYYSIFQSYATYFDYHLILSWLCDATPSWFLSFSLLLTFSFLFSFLPFPASKSYSFQGSTFVSLISSPHELSLGSVIHSHKFI